MTSPIGTSNPEHSFSVTPPAGGRSKSTSSEGTAANHTTQPATVRPTPIGPLGHNVDTSA